MFCLSQFETVQMLLCLLLFVFVFVLFLSIQAQEPGVMGSYHALFFYPSTPRTNKHVTSLCNLGITPNSLILFTRKCVAAGGEN